MSSALIDEPAISKAAENEIAKGAGSRTKLWLVLGFLAVVGAIGGYLYWQHASVREETDDAQVDGHIHPVSARVGGTVVRLLVKDNQTVKAGEVLVEVDPTDYQVAIDKAKADLAEAEAELSASTTQVPIISTTGSSNISSAAAGVAESQANVAAAEKKIDAAQARLRSTQAIVRQQRANYDRAAKDLERMKMLVAQEEISRQQFDANAAAAEASRAQVDSAEAQVHEAEQSVRMAQSELEQARARVGIAQANAQAAQIAPQQVAASRARAASSNAKVLQRKAELEQAQLNKGYSVVRAPIAGVISQRSVEAGQVIQPGQPLLAVVPLDDIWIVANYKESQLAHMKPGQKVELTVDAYGGKVFQGHVDSIAAATGAKFSLLPAENATGNYVKVVQRVPVKIVLEPGQDPDHSLRPGMSVVPTVLTK